MEKQSRGPVYWYITQRPEEGEALVNGDQRVITIKEGSAISTYEKLTEKKWHAGIIHGEKTYLFTMEQVTREGGHVKIQLGKPRLVTDDEKTRPYEDIAKEAGLREN